MREEVARNDITVVGGGLAGVCAAIAAARAGRTVALVQNRPVLGGNSSSEVRVWVCGATAHGRHRNARETGIMGELYVENQFRNPDGNPYYWDTVVLEAVRDEPNISLFLNTDVRDVTASGPANERVIETVYGTMMGSERGISFVSSTFLDCTGDGLIGYLAGAAFRIGREARAEYDEPWAPEVADDITLGSTLLFYTKDLGHPVKYVPPKFAIDVTQTAIPERRIIRSGDNGCAYWWIEWGGEIDTVHDNERIRDELWAVIYGIWDYIKNSGNFAAETMTLEWVGSIPGKREYRRFTGEYTLTQTDVLNQRWFDDRVAFGGWSIDLHPPGGVYATEAGSQHWHSDGTYHIPLRSLFSQNVSNLWFAGRNISASHVAFGTTRVMATCAVVGEAAGAAAALAHQLGTTPSELARDHAPALHRHLARADASVLGVPYQDPADLAQRAHVSASSALTRLRTQAPTDRIELDQDIGVVVPVDPELTRFGLLLDAIAATEVVVEVFDTSSEQNYVPHKRVAGASQRVEPGAAQWVDVEVPWRPPQPTSPQPTSPQSANPQSANAFIVVRANPDLAVLTSDQPEPGVLCFTHRPAPPDAEYEQPLLQWPKLRGRRTYCLRTAPESAAYGPDQAIGGYFRPFGGPRLWASDLLIEPQWLRLDWDEPASVGQVEIVFDDDVDEYLINLHHYRTPHDALPTLVRDYRVEALVGDAWQVLVDEPDNRRRRRVHPLTEPVVASALRLVVTATNGAHRAHVVALRAYE